MRDSDIRGAVKRLLCQLHDGDADTLIVEEMGVWSGSVRIDIAVINGELCGFELKSARDTLDRLARQSELYNQVFDRVTLVAAERHLDRALVKIPNWWGVTGVRTAGASVVMRDVRQADRNDGVDGLQVARLLWRQEAMILLERYQLDKGVRSKPVDVLAQRLAQELSLPLISREVRQILKARHSWLRKAAGDELKMTVHAD